MQLIEVLKGKEPSMKREVFAKKMPFLSEDFGMLMQKTWNEIRESYKERWSKKEQEIRVHVRRFPKVNTGVFCVDKLLQQVGS